MIRTTTLLCCLTAGSCAMAQTSIANGEWTDPATWDCSCVPSSGNVTVQHTVELTQDVFVMGDLHVAPGAQVDGHDGWLNVYYNLGVGQAFQNNGLVEVGDLFIGDISTNNGSCLTRGLYFTGDSLINNGYIT